MNLNFTIARRTMSAALFLLLSFLSTNQVFAQSAQHNHEGRNCSTMEVYDRQVQQNPAREQSLQELERYTEEYVRGLQGSSRNTDCREIPVVVTVVYANGQQNISQAQIESQMTVLNEDFAGTNSDFNPPSEFASVASGNTGISFVLQNVRRYSNSRSSWGTNDAVKQAYPPVSPATTLNMWVCNIGGSILGYAQFPGGSSSTDGVVMSPQYFGSSDFGSNFFLSSPFDKGRTTTHEVGHYLNLRHIWGDGGCNVDDLVSDTPVMGGASSGCPNYPQNTCTSAGNDMTMNYMDYTNDVCMYMFSAGQDARMWATLNSSRSSLGTDCGSGGGGGGGGTDCVEGDVAFQLVTDNYGSETTWSLTNGSGATVESGSGYGNNQTINLNWNLADGNYTFTINDSYGDGICCAYGNGSYELSQGGTTIASGGNFTSSETSTFCVENTGGGGGGGGGDPVCETLNISQSDVNSYGGSQDNGTVTVNGSGWVILNGNSWKAIDLNYQVTANTVIEFDFGSTTQGEIHGIGFDSDNGISSNRTFRLYGTQNWGINNYNDYAASAGSWKSYTIPVGQFYTGSFDRLFFVCDDDANSNGNSYYRNIKIYEGSCGGARAIFDPVTNVFIGNEGEDMAESMISLFPNPASSQLNVRFTAGAEQTTQARIMDATGRAVWQGQLLPGVNNVDISALPAGMYHLMTITADGKPVSNKFVKSSR